tara:strand:- start:801 stop:2384 length:1584 start_codon:yes stop_codon:yes gene_type:complete
MFLKKINNFIVSDNLLLFIIFLISFLLNKYYANFGVFPIDTFLHFDSGFRVLNGEYPIKDYWVVSGIFVDYLEAFFFYLLGASWNTHIFHSSFINGVMVIATYFVLRSFQFKKIYSFSYSFLFGILAYPPSGTPFVDHHAAFLSLLGIYCFILALNNQKNFYWVLMPIFFGVSFFSKQVPGSYIIIPLGMTIIFYSIIKRELNPIKYSCLGSLIFIVLVILIGTIQGISLNAFLTQYIIYPQNIADNRFDNFNFSFEGFINHYKFILLAIVPLAYLNIKNLINNKNYIKGKDFYVFLAILSYSFGLIFHQMLTKNQIFIYFLCPLLFAFLKIYLNNNLDKFKTIIFLIILILSFFITAKYHLRFNEHRKFHELINVNFDLSKEAYLIDKKLRGLKWITPYYKDNPEGEINFLKYTLETLKKDKRKKMVITNYLFFSTILNEKLYSPSRTYTLGGISFPVKGNKYFLKYKSYFSEIIKNNKIKVIYIISSDYIVEDRFVYDYLDKACINEHSFTKQLKKFEIAKCELM